jgi:hypothetical protein
MGKFRFKHRTRLREDKMMIIQTVHGVTYPIIGVAAPALPGSTPVNPLVKTESKGK